LVLAGLITIELAYVMAGKPAAATDQLAAPSVLL
jgi:hypothetical protein